MPPVAILNASNKNQAQVERYEIDLNILPSQENMSVNVLMSVRNVGELAMDNLLFTLNDNLVVEKIVSENWPLEWQGYEGGYYQVRINEPLGPRKEMNISVSYSGSISEWYSPGWQKQPEPLAFLTPQGIVLPGGAFWYPVLASQAILTQRDQGGPKSVETQFSVRVEGNSQPLVVNLPQIEAGYWEGMTSDLFLASADWHDLKEGDIHLWYTPRQQESADLLIDKLSFMYRTCEAYLGKTSFDTILAITVPENLYTGLKNTVIGQRTGVIFVTDTRLDLEARVSPESFNLNSYQHELFLQMLSLWINPHNYDRGDQKYAESLAIAGYIWTLFRDAYPGLPGTIEEEGEFRILRSSGQDARSWAHSFPSGLTFFLLDKAENDLWFQFDHIRRHDGDLALKRTMQELLSELRLEGDR